MNNNQNLQTQSPSNPVRLISILQELARNGPISPSDGAAAADLSLGSYAYHMRALHSLGVITLRRTRRVRGAVEHVYELTRDGHHAVLALEAVQKIAQRPR